MNHTEFTKIYKYLKDGEVPNDLVNSHARFGFKRKCRSYAINEDDDSLLYVLKHKDGTIRRRAKVVVGTIEDAKAIFREIHDPSTLSHPGLNRSMQQISKKYFWPRMTYDITEWIGECPVCVNARDSDKAKLTQLKITEPWEILTMNIIGPINETAEGYKYIFSATDFYSKWVEAFPICNKYPAEVAACLKLIYYRHGACKSVLSDEDVEFVQEVNTELCKQLGIEHHMKAVYHPKVKTFDDKSSEELRCTFMDLVSEHAYDWPHYIDGMLFTIRTKKHPITKFTPFFLLHKREARMPPVPVTDPVACIDSDFTLEHVVEPNYETTAAKDRSAEIRNHRKVIENAKSAHFEQLLENAKSCNDAEVYQYAVGEKVLLSNNRKRPLDTSNPELSFCGPFVISDIKTTKVRLMSVKDYTQVKVMHDISKLIPYKDVYKLSMFES